eukprot:gene2306-4490_t
MASPSGFLTKTFEIFSTTEYADLCGWGPKGDTIYVRKIEEFSKQILPKYFKHANFQSFVRQLNMYDFHKTVQDPNNGEFHHLYFRKDRPELMALIKRKANSRTESSKKCRSSTAGTTNPLVKSETDVNASTDIIPEMIVSTPLMLDQESGRDREEHDIERRVMELELSSNRLSEIEHQYARISGENQMLKRMLADSKNRQEVLEDKMEQVLKVVYKFYVSIHGNGAELDALMPSSLSANKDSLLSDEQNILEHIVPALTSLKSLSNNTDTSISIPTSASAMSYPAVKLSSSSSSTLKSKSSRGNGNGTTTKGRDRPPLRRLPPSLPMDDKFAELVGPPSLGDLGMGGGARGFASNNGIGNGVVATDGDGRLLSRQSSFDVAASSIYYSIKYERSDTATTTIAAMDASGGVAGDDLGAPLVRLGSSMDSFLSYFAREESPIGAMRLDSLNTDVLPTGGSGGGYSSSSSNGGMGVGVAQSQSQAQEGGELVRMRAYDAAIDNEPLDSGSGSGSGRRGTRGKRAAADNNNNTNNININNTRSRQKALLEGERKKLRRTSSSNDNGNGADGTMSVAAVDDDMDVDVNDTGVGKLFPDSLTLSLTGVDGMDYGSESETTQFVGLPQTTGGGPFTRLDSLESTLSSLLDLCNDEHTNFLGNSPGPEKPPPPPLTITNTTASIAGISVAGTGADADATGLERLSSSLERLSSVLSPADIAVKTGAGSAESAPKDDKHDGS